MLEILRYNPSHLKPIEPVNLFLKRPLRKKSNNENNAAKPSSVGKDIADIDRMVNKGYSDLLDEARRVGERTGDWTEYDWVLGQMKQSNISRYKRNRDRQSRRRNKPRKRFGLF